MRRKVKNIPRLRTMNVNMALAHCAYLTKKEWSMLNDNTIIDLWVVFRAYIVNGYKDPDIPIPSNIAEIWGHCKAIIDKEISNETNV